MDPGPVLRQILAETEELLTEAELDLRRLEERVRILLAERQGLQLALVRHRGAASEAPIAVGRPADPVLQETTASASAAWMELSRSEAVFRVLATEHGPMSRLQIVARLADAGRREDDADAVSAALAYLRRTGKVRRVGTGQWSIRDRGDA